MIIKLCSWHNKKQFSSYDWKRNIEAILTSGSKSVLPDSLLPVYKREKNENKGLVDVETDPKFQLSDIINPTLSLVTPDEVKNIHICNNAKSDIGSLKFEKKILKSDR